MKVYTPKPITNCKDWELEPNIETDYLFLGLPYPVKKEDEIIKITPLDKTT